MVVHVIFPDRIQKPVGGLGEQFGHIYSRLKHKINFQIMGQPEDKPMKGYYSVDNILPNIGHASLASISNYMSWAFESINCKVKPDLIHAYDWTSYLPSIYAARYWKVPLLCSMQLSAKGLRECGITYTSNYDTHDGFWIHQTHEETEYLGLKEADKIIHVSNSYAKRFSDFQNKSVIIPNGIDYKSFQGNYNKFKFPGNGKRKVVYIGRFAAMKNITELCKASIPENIDLYFIGDDRGGEKYIFQLMLDKCQEPNVHYLGYLRGQDKIDVLKSADAVILPSIHEPFGIVGLEALASNCILISSFVDGITDYLTEDIGINCGFNSWSISNALYDYANIPEEELNIRKEKGQKIAKQFDWDKLSQQYYKVYKDLKK
tara:strand:- start:2886 stop:4010 length:1125 start_codon:yes stop_codon:yes gene_type:complete